MEDEKNYMQGTDQMPGNLNPDPNENPAVRELLDKIENNDKNFGSAPADNGDYRTYKGTSFEPYITDDGFGPND